MGACQVMKMMLLMCNMKTCKLTSCLPSMMEGHLQEIISGRKSFLTRVVLLVQALGQPVVFTWCLFQYCFAKV